MAHNLTDVDNFTTPITVPDGADSRNNAAEVVEAIAQALANRTFALLTHAAFHDSPNHFSGGSSTFDEVINATIGMATSNPVASEASLTVFTSPDDDVAPGNKWKLIVQALLGGAAADAMVWTGIPAGEAQMLITINALWDPTTQQWSQQTAALHSFALMLSHAGLTTFSRVDSGSGAWSSWPVTGNTEVRAQTLQAKGSVNADADVNAIVNLTAGGDCTVVGDFLYSALRTEFRAINIASGVAFGSEPTVTGATAEAYFSGQYWAIGDQGIVVFPVDAPIDGTLGITRVMLQYTGGTTVGYTVELVRKHSISFGTPTLPIEQIVDSAAASIPATSTAVVTLDWGGLTVNKDETYSVRVIGDTGATQTFLARALQFQSSRPGPARV